MMRQRVLRLNDEGGGNCLGRVMLSPALMKEMKVSLNQWVIVIIIDDESVKGKGKEDGDDESKEGRKDAERMANIRIARAWPYTTHTPPSPLPTLLNADEYPELCQFTVAVEVVESSAEEQLDELGCVWEKVAEDRKMMFWRWWYSCSLGNTLYLNCVLYGGLA
ncbi:hypothetical protein BC829DRAFT_413448 [Chytridium lagenaria]|nr:hypothetical protein BC829DRAFT_413448 [Chytridium lagenaria]